MVKRKYIIIFPEKNFPSNWVSDNVISKGISVIP